ncbi:MAG: NERD domain-containing protein [Verrucomicrobia bacterium]|nr:NERD domain-containing protein [Verrucomicrobiota bacterium]
MSVKVIQCGEYANQSERMAVQRCKTALDSIGDKATWVLLSNLASSSSPLHQSDELDVVCIGPRGVFLIEVKHWDAAWMRRNPEVAEAEAEKLTAKARRLAGRVRAVLATAPRVVHWFLLTREVPGAAAKPDPVRGVPARTLKDIQAAFQTEPAGVLSASQVELVAQGLEPRVRIQLDGKIRRLAAYINLELSSPPEDGFHRIYRGVHHRTKEKVVLHLYDLSASEERDAHRLAEREFRALQLLQRSRWVPRFRDSLQDLPDYPGELMYFTVLDPGAPTLRNRARDKNWDTEQRVAFTSKALEALQELHGLTDEADVAVVHRKISPDVLLVGPRNGLLFTDFSLSRLPATQTLGPVPLGNSAAEWAAPEVRSEGLSAAGQASDVFSLCRSLLTLFGSNDTPLACRAKEVLSKGTDDEPSARASLVEMSRELQEATGGDRETGEGGALRLAEEPPAPPAEFWCEGQIIPFGHLFLRVVGRLGTGGVGRTFKVEQIDPTTGEDFGTFVAKVIKTREAGTAALQAYQRVRSHTAAPGLSVVFEVASEWQPERVVALLKWVEGDSLDGLTGVLPLVAEECGDESVEALLRRWLAEVCGALAKLHEQGLVHGDVSPRNLIHHRGGLTLTDYDLVTTAGKRAWGAGASAFCSPEAQRRQPLFPSDDLFALSSTLFQVAFEHPAFPTSAGALDKTRGLNWRTGERESLMRLAEFFDRATHRQREDRFANAEEALAWLAALAGDAAGPKAEPARSEQEVSWLTSLLRIYPGSPHGNIETRGLDSDFALATYVETQLEAELRESIRKREARLVILSGNAGDGKTALLQHLAASFGVSHITSAQRIWETRAEDGLLLRATLDGSAAWRGRSANELLDEFLTPFLDGPPGDEIAHLLAINDGRLFEWLDTHERANGPCALTQALKAFLASDGEIAETPAHVRFISLNHRSLVGGRVGAQGAVTTDFLERLVTRLLGGERGSEIWAPCRRCSAWDRCTAGPVAHRLLATNDTKETLLGRRLRERLTEALQAVHQRGEVHITARELRGALSYILFGVRSCRELHENPGLQAWRFWDMAFVPDSPFRQGELLRELSLLDPSLDAHPQLDRWLVGRSARDVAGAGQSYPGMSLESARRRAYFEWNEGEVDAVACDPNASGLAAGEHLRLFCDAALRTAEENSELCARLCHGISQLENLPSAALSRDAMVPLRITPRTPTETVFWVEKPLQRFRLEAEWPRVHGVHLVALPRRLRLIYGSADGREETLLMGYDLFHTLLALSDGEQLSELRSDALFANLAIFTQRLVQEDEAHMFAWNPKADETVHRLGIRCVEGRRVLACTPT